MSKASRKRHARMRIAKQRYYNAWLAGLTGRPYLVIKSEHDEKMLARFRIEWAKTLEGMEPLPPSSAWGVPVNFVASKESLTWLEGLEAHKGPRSFSIEGIGKKNGV